MTLSSPRWVPLALSFFAVAACSSESEESRDADDDFATGGALASGGNTGTTGGVPGAGGDGVVAGGGDVGTGGDNLGVGGTPVGTGGTSGSGGAPASGGALGSGGEQSSGGSQGTGSAPSGGEAGMDDEVDADGCPLTQQGFSTISGMGQDGTSGGQGGPVVTVSNQPDLEMYAGASEPYIIRVDGTITIVPKGKEVNVTSNKTIIGVGSTGEINEGGFILREGVHNVILRNLTIGNTFKEDDPGGETQDWDGVQMDTAHHIWIDHCDFHHGGDGLIDSRKDTTNLTVSWSLLRDHNKAFGIGWTENVTAEITIHHNITRNTHQRNPSTDNVLRAHLYNNWLGNITSYGNYSRGGTNMVIENSIFEDVSNPHYYDTGSLVVIGSVYEDTSGQRESSGTSYSFFDPSNFYHYDLHPVGELKTLLTQCTGPRPSLGL